MPIQTSHFSPAQQAVLNVISCLQTDEDLADLKRLLVKFINERLQLEMDKHFNELGSVEFPKVLVVRLDDFARLFRKALNQ